jgi:hypothetical protein
MRRPSIPFAAIGPRDPQPDKPTPIGDPPLPADFEDDEPDDDEDGDDPDDDEE